MAILVAIRGPSTGKSYPLEGAECVLGRSFNSDIYVGDLNVSRRHARIFEDGAGGHLVEDLGSGNGTFVNERRLGSAPARLRPDDVIRVGGSAFRYEAQPAAAKAWRPEVMTVVSSLDEAGGEGEGGAAAPAAGAGAEAGAGRHAEIIEGLPPGRATRMLEAMWKVADELASEVELDSLLGKILDHILDVFPQAERGFVLLPSPATGQLVPEAVKVRGQGASRPGLKFSQSVVAQVMDRGEAVLRASGARRASLESLPGFDVKSPMDYVPKMGAPLVSAGEVLGTLHLEGQPGTAFSQEDLALLTAIARQAALAIANARALQRLVDQKRLEDDLRLARDIQQSFLPARLPDVPGLRFEAHYQAAREVGGDFYDVTRLDRSRIGILVGDVSGKGVSAALLMAKLTTDIRLVARQCADPGQVLTRANMTLLEAQRTEMFATALYIVLDLERRLLTVANAGHQPPLVCSPRFEGAAELDDATAVALGVLPDVTYPQETYELVPGDVVLLYTDGINEALNSRKVEYGMESLRRAMTRGPADPRLLVQRIVADVRRFVGSAPQSDDQTLVAFGLDRDAPPLARR